MLPTLEKGAQKLVNLVFGNSETASSSTMSSSASVSHSERRVHHESADISMNVDVDPAFPAQIYANECSTGSSALHDNRYGGYHNQAMTPTTAATSQAWKPPAKPEQAQVRVADQRDAGPGEVKHHHRMYSEAVATQAQPPSSSSGRHSHGHSTLSNTEAANTHKAELEKLRRRYEKQIEEMYQKQQELRARLEQSQMNTQSIQNQYEHEHARRCAAEKLNDLRRNELQEAQAYLETSDTMSVQDVVSLVRTLNTEIFQFAASVAEATPPRAEGYMKDEDNQKLCRKIGQELASVVHNMPVPGVDPEFLFQTAIQVALMNVSIAWTTLFDVYAPGSGAQESIRSVYRSIRTASPHSVSARWRALVYSRHKYANPEEARNILYGKLERRLKSVVRAFGYVVTDQMLSGITPIADAIIKFDRAGGEAALSQSMVPIFIKAGEQFISDEMEDANGSTGTEGTVVGCIELGLESYERGDSGKRTSRENPLLLKPVVLLKSAFDEN